MTGTTGSVARECDVVVVGAGFAGLYMLYRLRELGLSARAYEVGADVGGTWYWNRYPGARCDIESLEYSYQFSEELQQEWEWSERYATQPEILRYVNHVADRFDLRRHIQFETRVEAAVFDERRGRWKVQTSRDAVSARFVVLATGCLSSANTPDFPGRDTFGGDTFHTGRWPHEPVDFRGKRIGVVGTGSSAIQSIPHFAEQAEHLYVFQRTANYSVPAHNQPLDPEFTDAVKSDYASFRAMNKLMPSGFGARTARSDEVSALEVGEQERREVYGARWEQGGLPFLGAFSDLLFSAEANGTAAEFVREKIREIVKDPKVAELLSPRGAIGCKRMCVDTGYYATFNRSNVTLIDVRENPIDEITKTGVRVGLDHYDLDSLVFATGFDAMTGAIAKIDIRGRGGQTLGRKWSEGPKTYLGLQMVGFPNLFTITGPGSPSVLTNMIPSIEQHVDFIADCLRYMQERGVHLVEPSVEAETEWVAHVNEIAGLTILPTCNSWYLGANIPGKPRVFMPYLGFPGYVAKCEEVVANGYDGFEFA